jgi:hypothetical protein
MPVFSAVFASTFLPSSFRLMNALFLPIKNGCAYRCQASVQMQLVSEGNGVKFQRVCLTTAYLSHIIFLKLKKEN